MKLLYCGRCHDIFALFPRQEKRCECRASRGAYLDDFIHAWYCGPCVPLGIDTMSFLEAIEDQPDQGGGRTFEAFVIPRECPTFVKKPA